MVYAQPCAQWRISSGTGWGHDIPQVFVIYYIRCIISNKNSIAVVKKGTINF